MAEVFYLNELADDFIPVQDGDKVYRFAPLTLGARGVIQSAIEAHVPKPVDIALAAAGKLSGELGRFVMEQGLRKQAHWPPAVDSEEGISYIVENFEIQAALVGEMLKRFHPELTAQEALNVAGRLSMKTFDMLARFAWTGRKPHAPNPEGPETPAP